jgi:hypothetical protein
MKILLAIVIGAHGAIHALGFVKAFRLAEVAQLPALGPWSGILWLGAALLLLTSAVLLVLGERHWWMAAAAGIVVSQALIFTAWGDAKYGAIANAFIFVALLLLLREAAIA